MLIYIGDDRLDICLTVIVELRIKNDFKTCVAKSILKNAFVIKRSKTTDRETRVPNSMKQ